MSSAKHEERLRRYTMLNLGIGLFTPILITLISELYAGFFHIPLVVWICFFLAFLVIIWMLINLAHASNSKFIRLPGLILWGIASPISSIFLFAAVYFGKVNDVIKMKFVEALEFSFSAFIRKTSDLSEVCNCKFFEISQNYLGYLLFAYVIAVTIQGINYRLSNK
ncbi:MAG: hypothetical protein JXR07_19580 [Reichenbachiella sp.]